MIPINQNDSTSSPQDTSESPCDPAVPLSNSSQSQAPYPHTDDSQEILARLYVINILKQEILPGRHADVIKELGSPLSTFGTAIADEYACHSCLPSLTIGWLCQ
jgi:hypothetical protein